MTNTDDVKDDATSIDETQEFFDKGKTIARIIDTTGKLTSLDMYKECLGPECDC